MNLLRKFGSIAFKPQTKEYMYNIAKPALSELHKTCNILITIDHQNNYVVIEDDTNYTYGKRVVLPELNNVMKKLYPTYTIVPTYLRRM